ncbi:MULTISPECIES: FliI/YscN family ATPase [unclassified Legionella]|uniref:FliI/YscN family ATPase n=1 Tax=unclassified Legionella TaxID=2622702 RepID=UPI00105582E1|nr:MULTISPECIES: FliI/YscN family ATPase [unclassified Legionella]MDI9817553.1 FliI/YscN family ATPase [Legionella sp. PL877]
MANWLPDLQAVERVGEIEQYLGLKLVANGPPQAFVGELCDILDLKNQVVTTAEVVGFEKGKVFLMPFFHTQISMGFKVRARGSGMTIKAGNNLLGRIVDAFALPLDGKGALHCADEIPLFKARINPLSRQAVNQRINTGIHAIDSLLPMGQGQRMGLFAGSGVGKTVLLGMMSKHMTSDVNVIALVGERGREVNDFIQQHLEEATLKKTVVIAACSDDSPLMRRQAVYTATAIAEYFCSKGQQVMLFMDSITRFAMAQREISLSLGEPPTSRGYTPTVFSLLPGIIERTGNFKEQGSITALYTVLVEGDDFNEPIADHMRALLDGHIVLTRELAHRGHYPAIDILQSISRLASQLLTTEEQQLINQVTATLSQYYRHKDMIEIGAYKPGNNPKLDHAVERIDGLNRLLIQAEDQSLPVETLLERFKEVLQ